MRGDGDSGAAYTRLAASVPAADRVGWKIGATNPKAQAAVGADGPVYAYLTRGRLHRAPERVALPASRCAIVEAEVCYELRAARRPFPPVAELVGRIWPAVELVAAPEGRLELLTLDILMRTNGAHHGLLLGEAPLDLPAEVPDGLRVAARLNDGAEAVGSPAHVLGHPLRALEWLLEHCPHGPDEVAEGALVTTGSCTPAITARSGDRLRARFGEQIILDVRLG